MSIKIWAFEGDEQIPWLQGAGVDGNTADLKMVDALPAVALATSSDVQRGSLTLSSLTGASSAGGGCEAARDLPIIKGAGGRANGLAAFVALTHN